MKYSLKQKIEGIELQELEVGEFFAVNKKVHILLGNYALYEDMYENEVTETESGEIPLGHNISASDLLVYCLDKRGVLIFEGDKEIVPLKQISNIEFIVGSGRAAEDDEESENPEDNWEDKTCFSCQEGGKHKDDNCTCDEEDEDPVDLSGIERETLPLPTKRIKPSKLPAIKKRTSKSVAARKKKKPLARAINDFGKHSSKQPRKEK